MIEGSPCMLRKQSHAEQRRWQSFHMVGAGCDNDSSG